jgi:hypothetical protein
MSDIENAIIENAQNPKKVSGDAGSVEQHDLKDQIEAEKFTQARKAAAGPGLGIKFVKIQPGGTV